MISVVIITRDRTADLLKAINSCLVQTYKDVEYIIVDNASEQRSDSCLDSLFLGAEIKNYRYLYSEQNLGVAEGRNLGFSLAKGAICFFLDDDAVIADVNVFDKAIRLLENDDALVALACNINQPSDKKHLVSPYLNDSSKYVLTYRGGGHFIKKSFWEGEQELYPKGFLFGSEEMYTALFIYKKNKRIGYDESLVVDHFPNPIHRKNGDERKLDIILNIFIARWHFYPNKQRAILFIIFVCHLAKNRIFNIFNVMEKFQQRYEEKNNQMTSMEYKRYAEVVPFLLRY